MNCLNIQIDSNNISASISVVQYANRLKLELKSLHANGYSNALRLSIFIGINNFERGTFKNEMASFSALEILFTNRVFTNICHLTGSKELHLNMLPREADLVSMALNHSIDRLVVGN